MRMPRTGAIRERPEPLEPGVTKLSDRRAFALMLRGGLVPLEPYASALTSWRCRCLKCGREVHPRYNDVQSGHGGCGWCAGTRVDADAAVAVMGAADLEPLEPYAGSMTPWRCRCLKCGREVVPRYMNIRRGGRGCVWCAQKRTDPDEAAAVMRAADLEPLEPYAGSMTPWRCRCLKCGREVVPRLSGIRRGQGGCVWCSRRKVDPDEAVAVMRAADLEPLEPYAGSASKWRCRCLKCGREVVPRLSGIRSGQGGCVFCGGNSADADEAAAVMRAAGLEPLEPYRSGKAKWLCRCTRCGRKVNPRYNAIQNGQGGCGWCAGSRVDPDEAAAVMRRAGLDPQTHYPGALAHWPCRCMRCGRDVHPKYATIQSGGGGCAWCAGQRLDPDEVLAVMRESELEPLEPYPGSKAKWRSRCLRCGQEVAPRYNSIQSGQGGCVHCARKCSTSCPCRRRQPDDARTGET